MKQARGWQLLLGVSVTLLVIQAGVRIALVVNGNFYWDDLIIIGQASEATGTAEYLFQNHDGHFMPAAFFVAGVANVVAPLQWELPAALLVVGSTVAALAVWRLLILLAGGRERCADSAVVAVAVLAAFAFYLFSPLTVPAFVWWSAGLNSLPFQAALAWIVGDALVLCRGEVSARRRRVIVARSALIFLVGVLFFEKSLFIAPVAFGVAVLWVRWRMPAPVVGVGRHRGDLPEVPTTPLTVAFTRARALWATLGVLAAVWAVIFLSATDAASGGHSLTQTAKLVWRSVNDAAVPGLLGGPWLWDRWNPSPPMAAAPVWLIGLGWLTVASTAAFAVWRFRGAAMVIGCAAGYVVGAQVPVMWNRSAVTTALELAQTMRYLPDAALVVAIALILVALSPRREAAPTSVRMRRGAIGVAVGVVAALWISSLVSTVAFSRSWRDNPTGAYLAAGRAAFAEHPRFAMFDQAVPLEVLLPVTYPNNQISRVFGGLPTGPTIVTSTSNLMVLDTKGHLVPGGVTSARLFDAGAGTCRRPEVRGPSTIKLSGPLVRWRWTVALSYCANVSGLAELRLGAGAPVRFLVEAGLHLVYLQLDGSGSTLQLSPRTPGLAMHTGAGRVGEVAEAKLLG